MMKTTVMVLVLALPGLVACSSTEGQDVAAGAASDRECRPVGGGTGSRMRGSLCLTSAEWEAREAREKAREDTEAEFFRRIGENAAQGQGPSFNSP